MTDVLFVDDGDRYSRLRLIAWWDQERLRAAEVLVVGAGAIGNEVLKNLAIMGGLLKFYVDSSGESASVVARPEVEREDRRARRAS